VPRNLLPGLSSQRVLNNLRGLGSLPEQYPNNPLGRARLELELAVGFAPQAAPEHPVSAHQAEPE